MDVMDAWDEVLELPENRSAFAAVRALIDFLNERSEDAASFAPFYLHGPPGTGKSLLISLLANAVAGRCEVLSANAFPLPFDEEFAEGTAKPAELGKLKRVRTVELLVVEDVHHLPTRAWEVFVQLLDERRRRGLPTVVTALAGPAQLSHRGQRFPARIASRLAAGLVVALEPWGETSRRTFVEHAASRLNLQLDRDLLDWLAAQQPGSSRHLLGLLQQLAALEKLAGSKNAAQTFRQHLLSGEPEVPLIERIAQHVSSHYQVERRHLTSGSRQRRILLPRHVSIYLARQMTSLSLADIGRFFSRDHSTVLHACQKIEACLQADPLLRHTVRRLYAELC